MVVSDALAPLIDSGKLRAAAKAIRDKTLAANDAVRANSLDSPEEAWLAWTEARHQAYMTYARAVLAIPDAK